MVNRSLFTCSCRVQAKGNVFRFLSFATCASDFVGWFEESASQGIEPQSPENVCIKFRLPEKHTMTQFKTVGAVVVHVFR